MRWQIDTFSLEKAGNRPDDYEDAAAYTPFPNGDGVCVAVSDGAAGGFESRLWSRTLANAFASFQVLPEAENFPQWIQEPAQRWHDSISWEQLKWYHRAKARDGAFATLLGVVFEESGMQGRWNALAVGDACLFQVRDKVLVAAFPLQKSEQFDTSPPLLSTQPTYNTKSLAFLTFQSGQFSPGDTFFLMTDALSHWFLEEIEAEKLPWDELNLLDEDNFSCWIEDKRRYGGLHNDDVTLVRCRFPGEKNL